MDAGFPAYAGMTIREDAMETNKRERRRYAQGMGRNAPRPQVIPRALVIPAKAGTYWMEPAYAKPSPLSAEARRSRTSRRTMASRRVRVRVS